MIDFKHKRMNFYFTYSNNYTEKLKEQLKSEQSFVFHQMKNLKNVSCVNFYELYRTKQFIGYKSLSKDDIGCICKIFVRILPSYPNICYINFHLIDYKNVDEGMALYTNIIEQREQNRLKYFIKTKKKVNYINMPLMFIENNSVVLTVCENIYLERENNPENWIYYREHFEFLSETQKVEKKSYSFLFQLILPIDPVLVLFFDTIKSV